ncbi:hypothetical protein ClosIBUN13A_CONTIG46g00513 [Clostridium sp. IBUN13A]|nr:hypothetical protein ClosIBUN125C_CONTIG68g03839 [Clostridium sp. IBUN125C]KJZ87958.1 hypothetical protein ClosIBUN13A_CONTIG46g00513 [Clostridium sp. IBUN13A]KJZ93428.1 hypothetical protein ClosIBUN62F_CONTIG43g01563 [Clostridium sp. IBUN62F]KJZ96438.1 hypothetical protein ClosIBUN22A_CONTIG113g02359 [Clostridium sp. IBUN22A]DAL62027.1 MAG TPA_asm: hypothetical protein [Caudoviricetes sp.]
MKKNNNYLILNDKNWLKLCKKQISYEQQKINFKEQLEIDLKEEAHGKECRKTI